MLYQNINKAITLYPLNLSQLIVQMVMMHVMLMWHDILYHSLRMLFSLSSLIEEKSFQAIQWYKAF